MQIKGKPRQDLASRIAPPKSAMTRHIAPPLYNFVTALELCVCLYAPHQVVIWRNKMPLPSNTNILGSENNPHCVLKVVIVHPKP